MILLLALVLLLPSMGWAEMTERSIVYYQTDGLFTVERRVSLSLCLPPTVHAPYFARVITRSPKDRLFTDHVTPFDIKDDPGRSSSMCSPKIFSVSVPTDDPIYSVTVIFHTKEAP